MQTRRNFLINAGTIAAGAVLLPSFINASKKVKNTGVQLYTFRKEMLADAKGTLQKIAALGIKQIESAGSDKGNYYGLTPAEMAKAERRISAEIKTARKRGEVTRFTGGADDFR